MTADPVVELPPCPTGDGGLEEQVAVHLCQQVRIEPPPTQPEKVDHLALRSLEYLIPFHAQRDYRAAWLDAGGKPLPVADKLLQTLGQAEREGLRSTDYPTPTYARCTRGAPAGYCRAGRWPVGRFRSAVHRRFLTLRFPSAVGRLPPRKIDPDWTIKPRSAIWPKCWSERWPTAPWSSRCKPWRRRVKAMPVAGNTATLSDDRTGGQLARRQFHERARGSPAERLRARLQASGDAPKGRSSLERAPPR